MITLVTAAHAHHNEAKPLRALIARSAMTGRLIKPNVTM